MSTRPPIASYESTDAPTTLLSTASWTSSSDQDTFATSTALTTPDLTSPRKDPMSKLEPMLEVFEGDQSQRSTRTTSMNRRTSVDLLRGPSVRDRASQFEQQQSSGPTPSTVARTRSTSPLRINRKTSAAVTLSTTTPPHIRRVPVPSTAPVERTARIYTEPERLPRLGRRTPPQTHRPSPELKRGQGSTRRMVQQWENLPETPSAKSQSGSAPLTARRVMSREYLESKPLPLPRANPIPASSALYGSPSKTSPYAPSPLQHLQTPSHPYSRKRSSTLTPSPSSYSLSPSPSGEKKRKTGGRSPLKEMLNVFGGGIKELGRKAKGMGKDKVRERDSFDMNGSPSWDGGMDRLGTNGLPGGIVFSDRMGDQEMESKPSEDPNVVRASPVMYLTSTPCSSVSPWGPWLTSYAALTQSHLRVTYCPIFHNPQSGHSTPRRVFSGTSLTHAAPAVAFSSIPAPEPGTTPDVELTMKDCVEVRSLRREEVRGRGIPPVPEGVGTEVLEMVWADGSKRYLGVEGVGGRLGWVSAIWDVLLACKSLQPQTLPPPSPAMSSNRSEVPSSSLASFPYPNPSQPAGELSDFRARILTLEARTNSSAPPVQKVGDTWVAASALGGSDTEVPRDSLRDSVQRMFDAGPDLTPTPTQPIGGGLPVPTRRESGTSDRIQAWPPTTEGDLSTERDLSIFSRTHSKRSEASVDNLGDGQGYSEIEEHVNYKRSETVLSFDPSDLNPSRSASQVRRTSTIRQDDPYPRRFGDRGVMPVLDEQESEEGGTRVMAAPTHISHITFPKPTKGGIVMNPSPTGSSIETGESATIRTPHTHASSTTTLSLTTDPTVLARLDSHSDEHVTIAKQMDGVQMELGRIITSLGVLVHASKAGETTIPQALDERLNTIGLDIKSVENALTLSNLATNRQAQSLEGPALPQVHEKLDSIAKLCEAMLAKQVVGTAALEVQESTIDGLPIRHSRVENAKSPGLAVKEEEEKSAGQEVAQIMAEVTGGSTKSSPRLAGIQVLHKAPTSPNPSSIIPPSTVAVPLNDATTKQVGEVLALVTELKDARNLQTQQTTDIARYLNELNTWLEKFVQNSSAELSSMSKRITTLVGPDDPSEDSPPGLPDLVVDVHSMLTEQKRRNDTEGMVGQRLDALLGMMGEERERHAAQASIVDQVLTIVDRQRQDNELLLRAIATDLTQEIRGEKMRFVEAMQHATSVNVQHHIDEFKKLLSAEVHKSMKELGEMREQKRALEHQISDLFALKAKHGEMSGENVSP
ncbi:hypothetical protein BCR39DRAFT_511504 [Naematelia encephala]|uniref:Uncharacterized protein n=1 Tax=Naematelia encephala TaxID=71784 RepID=A0A1Y2BM71_9TREE|nr:hypothetical protein BCR39DRAFT_511504 [Naematelia encephala]